MRDLQDVLAEIRAAGIQLWVRDGRLRYRPPDGLDGDTLAELRRRKSEIIAHLDRADSPPAAARRPSVLPLSSAQEGLWLIEHIHPGTAAYNLPLVLRLRGALDVPALMGAFADLEARHEILRTRYPAAEGLPRQDILDPGALDIALADFSRADPADARRFVQDGAEQPFPLEAKSPFRVRLVRRGADEHVLVIVLHHIAGDEASFAVLADDLGDFYAARRDGRAPRRPPLALQYADIALAQRRQLETGELDVQLAYWRRRLEDAPEGLRLPVDRPRRGLPSLAGGLVEFAWSERLTGRMLETARRANLTPFMLVLATYQIFLARWSGQSEVCVGTPVAAYRGRGTEHLIGNFLNTLVMRARPRADLTVADFLEKTGRRVLEAYQNRELPFDRLVAELGPTIRRTASPLFQTLFAFESGAGGHLSLPGLETEREMTELTTALFDLGLTMTLEGGRLHGGFHYDTALFDRPTITRAAADFERIAAAIADEPGVRIGDLPLPGGRARRDAPAAGADTAATAAAAADGTLTAMIASPASGEAVAVLHRDTVLSHAALERLSNRVARCLRSMGIGREDVVGISMPRSADMVAALLGILKAGAAYLPLDPDYPADRLHHMIAECSARVVLGRGERLLSLGMAGVRTVCLDRDRERIARFAPDPPGDPPRPSDLAYVLYTSGSTGLPKGVMVEHRSAAALLAWAGTVFGREDTRHTLAATSLSFDLSVFELFLPLTAGGTIVLVEGSLSLADTPPAVEPTLLNTVPSAARALLERNAIPAGVRTINLAGEPLPRGLVEALYAAAPRARVLNLYGPTEDTTYSTWCHVRSDPLADVGIGRPIAGTQAYLLDDDGEPVPPGAPGQIHLAGRGLARGYRGRPGLTAERFVPDPFGPPGSRMYATGDKGRFRADGSLDFLGRIDQQLKIRGYRIEPGEIEARLHRIGGVAQAAVLPRTSPSGARKLIAHVAPAGGQAVDAAFLRAELAASLPGYMIPDAFEIRDRLPLTANGKIDRARLAALAPLAPADQGEGGEPRTATEQHIADVWAEVLEVERVGIDDDFFALGGYSLLASRIIARLRTEPERGLILRDIFEAPTIRQLAARLEGRDDAPVAPVRPAPAADEVPASFAQERLWFIDQFTPGLSLYNIAVAWRLKGGLDRYALRLALKEILRRHESLRTRFVAADDGGPPIQIVSTECGLKLPVTAPPTSGDARSAALDLLAEDARTPFDLAEGPLLRALLIEVARTEHVLQVTIPHIVFDGWSVEILMRELAALYMAFHAGKPSPLPPLPIQYRDYARWQRAQLTGDVLDGHRRFWRERLRNIPKELRLDSDRPRPPTASFRGDSVSFTFDVALAADLRSLAHSQAATMFMLMSAVFAVLLFRYSRQGDFCIGYPSGNRTRRETEDLIGLFVNSLTMRIATRADMPFADLLTAVRDDVLAADRHRDYPFEKLVEDLQPVRDPSHHPIFQVWCSHARTRAAATGRVGGFGAECDRDVELPGLEAEVIEVPDRTAKFDLSMFVTETGDALKVDLEYAADLFDRATVERMAGQVRHLCRELVRDPGRPVGDMALLSEPERHRILVDWNRTARPDGGPASLHEAFERQVARTPNDVAVEVGSETLSYRDLNERANRLARHLQSLGVGPESLVGILLGRGADLVIGLLAVLKAGGAYVPLDAGYPARRLSYMLEDSHAGIVLTRKADAASLPPFSGRTVLIDADPGLLARQPSGNLGTSIAPQTLAYCLYTSGSTGHPKAVAISHGSAIGLLAWAARVYSARETARMLAATSVCFDLSVFEIFLPLMRGGTVVLVDDISLAAAGAPTLINTVPSSMSALAAAGAVPTSAGTINLAGEPLDPSLVAVLRVAVPGARIFNLYGPTEATTYATFTEIGADNRVTIGRPVDGAAVYILDDRLEPVPIGVSGHLHIGGPCLARGYLGRPGLTAQRFLPDPFGPPGSRIYATGDRARFLADGHIEFRGRTDHQVKFHGNRIELTEIEHALLTCPGVREAAVAVLTEADGTDRLAGFVTVAPDEGLSARSLAAELAKLLPRSLVPQPLTIVDSLPHLPNGKIDRSALRLAPAATEHGGDAPGTPPTTPTELLLAAVWRQVLDLSFVGIHSSFFSLGGHSMTAIQMSARLAQSTGFVVPLRAIFEHPTIAELAAYLDSGAQHVDTDARLQPIPRLDRSRRVRSTGIGAATS